MIDNSFVFSCSDIKYKYPQQKSFLLNNIDFHLSSNKCVKILGANGSGKSTLLFILSRLIKPISGVINFNHDNISKINFQELSKIVGYIFQNPENQIFGLDIKSELEFGLKNQKINPEEIKSKINFIKDYFNFNDLNQNSFELSFGWKKLLSFSCIYLLNPKILIIDEPEIGLDPFTKLKIENLLIEYIEKGNSVIFTSHSDSFLSSIDFSTLQLENGKLKTL